MGRLVILSGPSCVGKSPLEKALKRFYPELRSKLQPLVLYNDRAARPGELDGIDYHFRSREEIEGLDGDPRYAVMEVRGDMQALDIEELGRQLEAGDVLFEGNPFVGTTLLTHEQLKDVPKMGAFMAMVSLAEIEYLKDPAQGAELEKLITDVMRRKLLRRTKKQKGEMSLNDLEEIERRCGSAYKELRFACKFEHVIPNHDGEDSDNWDAFYFPLGDAGQSLHAFAGLLTGETSEFLEVWPEDLIP